jgi:hypothetical protein
MPRENRSDEQPHYDRHPCLKMRLTAAICLALLAGCGGPLPQLVPVEGMIVIDGQPAAEIAVQFLPDERDDAARPTSYAISDPHGHFTLATYDQARGAVCGSHTILLVDTLEERPEQGQPFIHPPRLNASYATITGGLRAEVCENGGSISIDIESSREATVTFEPRD